MICAVIVFCVPFGYFNAIEKLKEIATKPSAKQIPTESLPVRFDPNDPDLKFVKIYNLKKEIDSVLPIGK